LRDDWIVVCGQKRERVFAPGDPRIHPTFKDFLRKRWLAGSSPAMTVEAKARL
jgi:hypothetical protein